MEKQCFKCKESKPLSEFYKHPMMGDGRLGKCKKCAKKDVADRVDRLSKNPAWLASERERCRKKQEKYRKLGLYLKVNPETRSRWIMKNPHKVKAHQLSSRAVRSGKLIKKNACEMCGASGVKIEKHHPDYSKPLFVQWLCVKCHGKTRRLDVPTP